MTDPPDLESLRQEGPLEIRCHRCKRCLARALRILGQEIKLQGQDAKPVVPAGSIASARRFLEELDDRAGVDGDGIIANRSDLVGAIDGGVRNGCCGPDGTDGPNLLCPCGHEIGTEFGDCWTPHFVSLNARWIDLCPHKWGVKGPDEK